MSSPQSAREFFDAALEQYLTRLVHVSNALRERQQQAIREYLEAGAAMSAHDQQSGNSREYENLLAALHSQNAGQIAAAQAEYLGSLRRLQKGVSEAAQSALNPYLARIQAAWQEAQSESRAHCAAYIEEVKKAFAQVSPEADSATLSAVGQSLMTAAFYSAASMQFLPEADDRPKVQAALS
jgi:hypothetical protein